MTEIPLTTEVEEAIKVVTFAMEEISDRVNNPTGNTERDHHRRDWLEDSRLECSFLDVIAELDDLQDRLKEIEDDEAAGNKMLN